MKYATALTIIPCLSTSFAAPSKSPRAVPGSISKQCTNIRIDTEWLVGECLTGDGTTRITTGTHLSGKITNDDGNLSWNGDRYHVSCRECSLLNGGSDLNCLCNPHQGAMKNTTINLDEHIGIYSGHMLSDIKGAPTVPDSPSKYPWPSDRRWGLGGNATCPSPVDGWDWCHNVAFGCSNQDPSDFRDNHLSDLGPIPECFIPVVYAPDHFTYNQLKLMGDGAWELTGYADEQCKEEVIRILPDEMGTCNNLSTKVKAITLKPLFNGDPN